MKKDGYLFTHVVAGSAIEMVGRPLKKLVLCVDLRCLVVAESKLGIRLQEW